MREKLSSRLGFLMLAAGSAVGLGNVWRFPYIAGRNGGGAFVLVYIFFLAVLGFPLLAAELGIGRGARRSLPSALPLLGPRRLRPFWRRVGATLASGCFILMIYYTDVTGWLFKYTGDFFAGTVPSDPSTAFSSFSGTPSRCLPYMLLAVAFASAACLGGVAKGVERITKTMMLGLLAILVALAVDAAFLPGAREGIRFYLKPDWGRFMEHPVQSVFDAMGQAFFTLSLGIGSMTICGSYVDKSHSLVKESFNIIVIDTLVALVSGLVVFSACASYGVPYAEGPGLIFAALPKVFAQMPFGAFWGALFFLFLSFAALTTVVAVFECLIAGVKDVFRIKRPAATFLVGSAVAICSLPAVFSSRAIYWEDFAVSMVWLPLGALTQGFFVVNGTFGWGWDGFRKAVSIGSGWNMPGWMRYIYVCLVPVLVLTVFVAGLVSSLNG